MGFGLMGHSFAVLSPVPLATVDRNKTKTPRLMVVDLDVNFVESQRRVFRPYDVDFLAAFNSKQASWRIATEKPDLIISDTQTLYGDGQNLVQWLQDNAALRSIPVIVASSESDTHDIRCQQMQPGADDFVAKPVATDQMRQVVGRYIPLKLKER
ncbi:regulator of RpoS [Novipirellula caenicola]|uniref:Regulator of RpoS n=2 Tax=Novipirellula caenicola TaxID=1536901 RepID=A0ABP9VJZ3_9BACT